MVVFLIEDILGAIKKLAFTQITNRTIDVLPITKKLHGLSLQASTNS
jgi:hypothetical protein